MVNGLGILTLSMKSTKAVTINIPVVLYHTNLQIQKLQVCSTTHSQSQKSNEDFVSFRHKFDDIVTLTGVKRKTADSGACC